MAELRKVPVADVRVGGRVRKDMGDLTELAASIKELGLLQPVGLDIEANLIFGERRYRAVQLLGWTEIPALIFQSLDDALLSAKAERAENTCRKEFTPTEMVEAGRRIEVLERPKAEAREKAGHNQHTEPCGNFPQGSTGRTRDKVGEILGVSGSTFERAKQVVEAAEKDPEKFGDLPERMDTKSVNAAHTELKNRQGVARGKPYLTNPESPLMEHVRLTIKGIRELLMSDEGLKKRTFLAGASAIGLEILLDDQPLTDIPTGRPFLNTEGVRVPLLEQLHALAADVHHNRRRESA